MARVRSLSMNGWVGDLAREWTDTPKYSIMTKMDHIKSPAMTFIFLDEREDSINDGWYASNPVMKFRLVDYPAGYHGEAGGFSFADGHSEIKKWLDKRTVPVLKANQLLPLDVTINNDPDIGWIQQRAIGSNSPLW
jgi:prepilin-type processing-associated H-X9-DG protein